MIETVQNADGTFVRKINGQYGQVHKVQVKNKGICFCAVHCAENYCHEKACCSAVLCDCWCHLKDNHG